MLYRVLQPIHVPPGVVLTLDGAQARARSPWLLSLGGSRWESAGMLTFKAGEQLGIEGDTPRAFHGRIEAVKPVEAAQAAPADPGAPAQAADQTAHQVDLLPTTNTSRPRRTRAGRAEA